ncbi:signal-regulatory protein delta-like [Spheniscus humboldti]
MARSPHRWQGNASLCLRASGALLSPPPFPLLSPAKEFVLLQHVPDPGPSLSRSPQQCRLPRETRDGGSWRRIVLCPGSGAPCQPQTLLLLCPGAGAQAGRGFELQQPQDKVWVAAGETLILTCTMSGGGPPGAVRWLKGLGSGNKTVYEQKGSFPRVTRVVSESDTDFSIHIRDVRAEDAGTYYCVKFKKSLHGGDEVFQRGNGTEVSVRGPNLLSSPGSCLGTLLEKGLLGGLLVFLFKRWRA